MDLLVLLLTFCIITTSAVHAADPVFNNLPNSADLQEDVSTEILLSAIGVTDADGDAITCDIGPASNPGSAQNDFRVKMVSGTWGIYTVAGVDYDYGNPFSYSLQIRCDDGANTVASTFTVNLLANQPPSITNLPDTVTLSTSQAIGYNIFTVTYTDPESDQVTLSITCDPVGCPFDIFDAGPLQLNADISGTLVTGYDVHVTPTDINGNAGTTKILSVIFSDINDLPVIQNLGTTVTVPENSAFGATLATTTCTDSDVADTLSYSMLCSPTSGSTYFQIDASSGVVSTTNSLINYETISAGGNPTTFTCTVTCSDGEASDTATLTLAVTDVNEAPSFPQNAYSISVNEGAAGTLLQTTAYGIIDEDVGDTKTFTYDCGTPNTGYFSIDSTTGLLSYSTLYDVDAGTRPTSVSCTVTVTDQGGLTHTVTLGITIANINDNSPLFLATPYTWFVSYGASVSTIVGTVTATDADIEVFGNVTYSLDQSGLGDAYFGINQNGQVYVQKSLTALGSGNTATFPVSATDGGGIVTQSTITIVITPTTTTTTTTTTDRYRKFFEDGRNIAWFVTSCILFLVCLAVVSGMCYFYTQDGCLTTQWRRPNRTKKREKRNWGEAHREGLKEPPAPVVVENKPRPPGDGFNFWSTGYAPEV